MSGTINKVIIIGNVGSDPEISQLQNGIASRISVATSENYTRANGEKVSSTEWHSVTFFGKVAEIIRDYGRKGQKIYVEGKIKTSNYVDAQGVKRWSTGIIGREFKFLSSKNDAGFVPTQSNTAQPKAQPEQQNATQGAGYSETGDVDDLPF